MISLLLPPTIIENIIHFCGIFGNLNIIIATVASKNLRSRCNLLIAMQALFDIFGEFGGLIEVFIVYTSTDIFIDSYLCFFLQLLPTAGITMSTVIMLMIGIDRVISIKYPIRYSKLSSIYYLGAMLAPGLIINLVSIPFAYITTDDTEPEICIVGRIYSDTLNYYYLSLLIVIYVSSIGVYIYMFYLVKTLKVNNASIQMTRKIQKSLILIVSVTVGGWLIGIIYSFVAFILVGDALSDFDVSTYATWKYFANFTYLGMAASYYILFYNSFDYRRAFQSTLRKYFGCARCMPKQSSIRPITVAATVKSSHISEHH